MIRTMLKNIFGFLTVFCLITVIGFAQSAQQQLPAIPKEVFPETQKTLTAPSFFVRKIEVIGNALIPENELDPLLAPGEGKEIDLQTLQNIAASITRLYAAKGHTFARAYVPPQKIENGIAKIYVLEGRVGNITIRGNRVYSSDLIRYYLSNAIRNNYFDYDNFVKAMMLINEFPDLHAKAFIRPGSAPGTSDVEVSVADKPPIHAGIDYDNFGNRLVGRNRAGLEVWDGNLTGHGDLLDLRAVFSFPSNQNPYYQAQYNIPVSPSGGKVGLFYSNAEIVPGQELQVLDIRGTASIYGLSYSRPLVRTLRQTSNVTASFYSKDVNEFIFSGILNNFDRIREVVGAYDSRWISSKTQDLLQASFTQGLGAWFGGMGKNNPLASRPGADDTFTKTNASLSHIMKVGSNYLILRGDGQWAFSPLTVVEQYSVGGPDSVEGYQQSEILGDSGWTASAEFRVPLNNQNSSFPIQAAVNIGTGSALFRLPQPGESRSRQLTGTGVGLRAKWGESTSMRADIGFPLSPGTNQAHEYPVLYAQFATQF